MSTSPHDEDGWINESAPLFRAARRDHDPTPVDRARLEGLLSRIDAGSTIASQTDNVARAVVSAVSGQLIKVSLAIVGVAAALITTTLTNSHTPDAARSARPVSSVAASADTRAAELPAPAAAAVHVQRPAEDDLRARGQRQRVLRANTGKQRSSRAELVTRPDTPLTAAPGDSSNSHVSAAPSGATQRGSAPPLRAEAHASTETPVAAPPAPAPAPAPASTANLTAAPRAQPVPTQDPRAELALLTRVHAALREADFSRVLELCAEHERRWPHGVFELEREGLRAIAACGANTSDALARAKRFLTAHPHVPVAMRVSAACSVRL
jgi:hypothetical protein